MKRLLFIVGLLWVIGTQLQAQQLSEAEADSCCISGVKHLEMLNCTEALLRLEKAHEIYHNLGLVDKDINVMCHIGSAKKIMDDIQGAWDVYHQASCLADSVHNATALVTITIEQFKLCSQLSKTSLMNGLVLKLDSLASLTDDASALFEYNNLKGDVERKRKNYVVAERWYGKNQPYISGVDQRAHIYYLKLRDLYGDMRLWDKALEYALLCVDEEETIDETNFFSYLFVANCYKKTGDQESCYNVMDELVEAAENSDNFMMKDMIYTISAICYAGFGDYERALGECQKANKLLSKHGDSYPGERMNLLSMMGGYEYQLGHYEEAVNLYREYANGISILYGKHHPEYVDALFYLTNAEGYANQLEAACSDYTLAVNLMKQLVKQDFPYLTTDDRYVYWKSASELFQHMTPFALAAGEYQTAFTQSCYDGLVLTKAFLLDSERSMDELIKTHGTKENLIDYKAVSDLQAKIRELGKDEASNVDTIMLLSMRKNQIEAKLLDDCPLFANMTAFMDADYLKIKESIGEDDVLIDFTDFVKRNGEHVYAAYVINQEQDYPLLMRLFAESAIDSLQIAYPDMFYESPYAEELYKLLWEPFQDLMKEGSTVYYVPSQLLFRIALESLPLEDGTILGDHYRFIRLSSARELSFVDNRLNLNMASKKTHAVLYGGLSYSLDDNIMAEEANKYNTPQLLASRGDVNFGGNAFDDLPGTKAEIDSIEKIMASHQLWVKSYSREEGTEESFVNMSGEAPQILHLATHGFYYTPDDAQEINYLRGYKDAMSLSGLVMSGGNAAWLGHELPEGVLGGILTASDIARLDLHGMELAVLPACHSGNGEATEEGLYGLQRAFKKAGAKTMVMSLWEVSDMVATEFMTCFYENLLDKENAFDKRKAFDKAKSKIREKYPEPYYWAGFVMLD